MATSNYQLCDNCNAKTIYIGKYPSTRFLIFCNDECCLAYAAKRVVQQTTDVNPDNEKLKPCPFCGDEADEETIIDKNEGVAYTPWYQAVCRKCDFWLPGARDEATAIAQWNRRANAVQQATDVAPVTVWIGRAAGNGRHPDGTQLFVLTTPGLFGSIDGTTEEEWRKDPMMIYAARQLAPRPLRFVDVGTLTWSERDFQDGNYFPPVP